MRAFVSRGVFATIVSTFFGAATSIALAQTSGAVPATCTINANNTALTCTTTVSLSGVAGAFAGGALTLTGAASGPQCNGGLTASPQSNLTPNTPTAISMQACPSNTNRSSLDFRWVTPAAAAQGQDPWFGGATATLASGASVTYSVDVCESTSPTANCTRVTTSPITATGGSQISCNAISPASQTVNVGVTANALNANCSGATGYQWFTGSSPATGTPISGATGATYTPPTSSAGTTTYSVRASNGSQNFDNSSSASVTVNQVQDPPGGCSIAGEPRVSVNYTTDVLNFAKQQILGPGVHVTKVTVGTNDSSIGKQYPPTFNFTQDDTTLYSQRTVSLSRTCNDFNPATAQILVTGADTSTVTLVTTGDSRSGRTRVGTVSPGVWYITIRNDTCAAGTNCSFTGIWRNWNR
jgi:hypothetical protein